MGKRVLQLDIPQFSGEVRLMAVSYRNERFGSAESKMTVADPLVLSTALPRFLTPSDSVLVPVTITNTTAKTAMGSAILKTTGGIQVAGTGKQDLYHSAQQRKALILQRDGQTRNGNRKSNRGRKWYGRKIFR